jgi:predicted TIM-barrel fold metal-dependent hydrolase
MNVDVDSHFFPLELFSDLPKEARDFPQLEMGWQGNKEIVFPGGPKILVPRETTEEKLKLRIDAMKEAGFDKQCLEVNNGAIPHPFLTDHVCKHLCQAWNNAVARVIEKNECFVGIAQVPHTNVESALEEARRAVIDLGFPAIEIHGRWEGNKNVESEDWLPFFSTVEKLGVPLWFHTFGQMGPQRVNPWLPANELLRNFPPTSMH